MRLKTTLIKDYFRPKSRPLQEEPRRVEDKEEPMAEKPEDNEPLVVEQDQGRHPDQLSKYLCVLSQVNPAEQDQDQEVTAPVEQDQDQDLLRQDLQVKSPECSVVKSLKFETSTPIKVSPVPSPVPFF